MSAVQPPVLPSLTGRDAALMMMYGAILWFAAALLLQYLGPRGAYEGGNRLLAYALVIPGTFPFVLVAQMLIGRAKLALGLALATGTATLLDGIALAWFPALYGGEAGYVAGAGAAILWGAGVAIMLGFVWNRPFSAGQEGDTQ